MYRSGSASVRRTVPRRELHVQLDWSVWVTCWSVHVHVAPHICMEYVGARTEAQAGRPQVIARHEQSPTLGSVGPGYHIRQLQGGGEG
eukprot:scaffold3372_cov248-Prasinococcus_capsulatus_cf.AAC.2